MDEPIWQGYIRSFVPAVSDWHPLYPALVELLPFVDIIWYDTDKTFPASKKRRRRYRRRPANQRLRTISEYRLTDVQRRDAVPRHLHSLLVFAPEATRDGRSRRFKVADPEWYRLQTSRFYVTHQRIPTDAAREAQSLRDRSWQNGRASEMYGVLFGYGDWDDGEHLQERRSRESALYDLDQLGVRPLRLRL